MNKKRNWRRWTSWATIILCAATLGRQRLGASEVGDGGDQDPTTFSFFSDNRVELLKDEKGEPLRPERVPLDYGERYTILAEGVDVCSIPYAWKLGYGGDHPKLLPKYMNLSTWEKVSVENGWVAIDPETGRFKFASENPVQDPRRLEFVKSVVLGNLTCWQIEVRDGFTFMPTEEETHGLLVMDARNPDRLRYAGYCPMGGYAMRVQVLRDHAYTFEARQFSIADIRGIRDHKIRYVKTIPLAPGGNVKCAWHPKKNFLYVRAGGKVLLYDVKDEDDPVLLRMLPLDGYGIAVEGDCGYLAGSYSMPDPSNPGKMVTRPQLRTYKIRPNGDWEMLAALDIDGSHGFWGDVDRGLHVRDGLAVTATTTAFFIIDVSNPRKPRLLKKMEELRLQSPGVYFGGGSGAKDYDLDKGRLFVATSGSVVVLDVSNREDIRQVASLSGPLLSGLPADFVRYEKGFLYIGQIYNGLCLIDIRDLERPQYKGGLPAFGEVEYAEPCGEFVYAVSSGLYVIRRYPAEEAELLGYASTYSHMFGGNIVSSPYARDNPRRIVFLDSSGNMRKLTAEDPYHPKMLQPHPAGGVARGQWVGPYLFAPAGDLVVYRVDEEGQLQQIGSAPASPGINRVVVRGPYAFGVHCGWGNKMLDILQVFDISDPGNPKMVAKKSGPADAGSMHSWTVSLFGDFLYLGGWQAGGGWGNFPGIRVYDISNPLDPKPHALIHHIPKDISVNSLCSPQTFYAVGNTLYVADYWTGLHVIDIADLKEKRQYRHLATIKDPFEPWSGNSYCTSVAGHGRYIYTTNFGRVDLWEIPVPSDVPEGKITWKKGKE